MSLINEYRATEEAIKELQERLKTLSQSGKFQKELEFEKKLRELMADHNKSLRDIIEILEPSAAKNQGKSSSASRRSRKLRRYKNPHSGEVIETKGGNHSTLKAWKAKWGADTVESWVRIID